jgi:nicotinamide phosphoribosyltransferase
MSSFVATRVDGYKFGHRPAYPEGTTRVQVNWTPRGSRIPGQEHVVWFGLQHTIRKYLMEDWATFFNALDSIELCARYERRVNGYLGPNNNVGSDHIAALHDVGYLPLEIRALPEGTLTPLRVPQFIMENTIDEFFWLPNYMETLMSLSLWMPSTSATTSFRYRTLLDSICAQTGSDPGFVGFQAHDFSMRGHASLESAMTSGAGHLLFFEGTDTVPAIDLVEDYYSPASCPLPEDYFIGGSIPATEHSVQCAGGKDTELETYLRLINDIFPEGPVSIVSDTWDFWAVLTEILPAIKDYIMVRDGKLVIRPDSGDPVLILVGDPNALPGSPEFRGAVEILWDTFGGTLTSTGHKMVDGHVGLIYGDSITTERAAAIAYGLEAKGFASGNFVLGIGSYTYQYVTRDTYGYAMKATWVRINGEGVAIFKDPKTDSGLKKSAIGRLAVLNNNSGELEVVNNATPAQEAISALRPVWRDGEFIVEENFATIRERARSYL